MARALLTALLFGAAAAAPQPDQVVAPLCISAVHAKPVDGDVWEFSNVAPDSAPNLYTDKVQEITGKVLEFLENAPAHFFQDVWLDHKEKGVKHYRATKVDGATCNGLIKQEMDTRGAKHALLYVHGFTNTPEEVFEIVDGMNKHLEKSEAFMIPVVWPSKQGLLKAYAKQKDAAKYIVQGLERLLRDVEFEMPISIVSHSMGNYFVSEWGLAEWVDTNLLQRFPGFDEEKAKPPPKFKVDNIFMVAADVRANIFQKDGVENKIEDGSFVGLPGLVKEGGKVHVLFNWWDAALLFRRLLNEKGGKVHELSNLRDAALLVRRFVKGNRGAPALGKIGYDESKISGEVAGMLVKQDFSGFGLRFGGGHGYQKSRKALDYYLAHLS